MHKAQPSIVSIICKVLLPYFTGALIILEISLSFYLLQKPNLLVLGIVIIVPYLIPVTLFRMINTIKPQPTDADKETILSKDSFAALTVYHLQLIYNLFPFLEAILIAFPGLFSFWLRLWGSKVGKDVTWANYIAITDRSRLVIGNNVFFGNLIYLSSYVVTQTENYKACMIFKSIKIGNQVFIGAGCNISAGVIEDNAQVPILTNLSINQKYTV